ncbi:hypothetical protein IHE44_0012103 [Lamprotornis superbus]|uniref:DH domain-containing protein n=4 Tax=Passeriformes TaxID=9126 RepID=A0A835P2R0_9PASS|nr:hypothetical protein IHE44_0012103 [Lamprotornis superbus]
MFKRYQNCKPQAKDAKMPRWQEFIQPLVSAVREGGQFLWVNCCCRGRAVSALSGDCPGAQLSLAIPLLFCTCCLALASSLQGEACVMVLRSSKQAIQHLQFLSIISLETYPNYDSRSISPNNSAHITGNTSQLRRDLKEVSADLYADCHGHNIATDSYSSLVRDILPTTSFLQSRLAAISVSINIVHKLFRIRGDLFLSIGQCYYKTLNTMINVEETTVKNLYRAYFCHLHLDVHAFTAISFKWIQATMCNAQTEIEAPTIISCYCAAQPMPSCEPPFVPVLSLSWQKLSSLSLSTFLLQGCCDITSASDMFSNFEPNIVKMLDPKDDYKKPGLTKSLLAERLIFPFAYSPQLRDLVKETCASVEPLEREADLHRADAALSESSSPEDVFSSSEMQTVPVCMDTTVPPGDSILRRGHREPPLLRLPTEQCLGIQFDRHARARISTSPTLRRLRMASASQALPFPDCSDTAQLRNQKQYTGSLHHICKSPPRCITISSLSLPSCVHAKLLSSKAKSERTIAALESDLPRSKLPSQEDPLSNGSPNEPPRNSWRGNSATLPTRLSRPSPTLWAGVQASHDHKNLDLSNNVELERPLADSLLHQQGALHQFPGQPELTCAVVASRRSAERRRSSLVVSLPGLEVFPGDLLVSDSAMDYLPYSSFLLSAGQAQAGVCSSEPSKSRDGSVHSKSWHEFIKEQQTEQKDVNSRLEVEKEAAVWELFTSECTYFLDHLLVLKMVFMNTLKYLQNNEFLLDVDLWRLFANLEELNKISLNFLKTFFETVKKRISKSDCPMDFSSVLRMGDLCQTHQIYCLNYTSAVFYLEKLRQREDFGIYLKLMMQKTVCYLLARRKLKPKADFLCLQQWCEQNEQCKRLHLPELLVAPLHRLTRYPLLLNNIWKRSTDETEKSFIQSLKEKVEKSIRDLEGKVKWLDNFQKFRQLQEVIIWPQVWDRDKRFFVPECLKQNLRENSSENILSSVNRLLLHEGRLMLAESTRLLDVYLFLFDDFLLITKIKRNKKKYGGSDTSLIPVCPSLTPELQSFIREGGFCTVLDQPIPLDRLILKNVEPIQITVFSLRNAFLIQHENRYRQCIAVFLLQAQTETAKNPLVHGVTFPFKSTATFQITEFKNYSGHWTKFLHNRFSKTVVVMRHNSGSPPPPGQSRAIDASSDAPERCQQMVLCARHNSRHAVPGTGPPYPCHPPAFHDPSPCPDLGPANSTVPHHVNLHNYPQYKIYIFTSTQIIRRASQCFH